MIVHFRLTFLCLLVFSLCALLSPVTLADNPSEPRKTLAYITSDQRIPFWNILARGVQSQAQQLGYEVLIFSADNSAKQELQSLAKVIQHNVDGLIISPTTSSAGATLIKLANAADIPVVVADIGADSDQYLSFISFDNYQGAYDLGLILSQALKQKGWQEGRVGIVSIPQRRLNGRQRTEGFLQALDASGIQAGGIRQQVDFSYAETYSFSRELIDNEPELRAIWLQGSNRYQAALDAIRDAGREGSILLATFDAEPEFIQMIQQGSLVGSAMQQPFLMGEQAVRYLDNHFEGKPVPHQQRLPILAISAENLESHLSTIQRNVLGQQITP